MANSMEYFVNGSIVVVRDGKRVKPPHGSKFVFTKEEVQAASAQPGLLTRKAEEIEEVARTETFEEGTQDNGDGTSGGTGGLVKGTPDSSNGQSDTGAEGGTKGTTQTAAPTPAAAAGKGQPKAPTDDGGL